MVRGEIRPDGAVEFISESSKETEELGVKMGGLLNSGDLLFLWGDLGSGKTLFVRGIAEGLSTEEPATSPTFALVHKYEGRLPVYHLDLYRINSRAELRALALEEMESEGAVILVEWGEYARDALSGNCLEVFFERGASENERKIRLKPQGGHYPGLVKELVKRCG